MNYWILLNNDKLGPMPIEEVLKLPLTPDTLVWRKGLASWQRAADIPELSGRFSPIAPVQEIPVETVRAQPQPNTMGLQSGRPPKPRTYIGWSIASLLLCCWLPSIVALVYGIQVSSKYDSGDYAGAGKASERASLWLIISIVAGLVAAPFTILISMMM